MTIVGSFELVCNTVDEIKERNAKINQRRDIVRFSTGKPNDQKVMIVGGGSSLVECLDEIKARKQNGFHLWATNNTYKFLQSHGIQPDAHVILDARPENIEFLTNDLAITYFLHVSCDPSLFDKLNDCNVIMYDLGGEATGTTVGLKALYLAGFSGFSEFYLYGFDSSYRDKAHHAYSQPLNDSENVIEITVEGRSFKCAPWMAIQAEEFQTIAVSFAEQDKIIHVAGDGLLPFIAHRMAHVPKVLNAVWDLQLCPTSYDFGTFLGEAEKRRLEIGAEFIDMTIQPGPIGGFRHDDLPPNVGAREGMLYRVIVGMARLLPSIRNIEILKARRPVVSDNIFPDGYTIRNPSRHYGHGYAASATSILRSTAAAKEFIKRRQSKPYMTITLREASHWPTRNSNKFAWRRAAKFIEKNGYEVVWIPDAESQQANVFSFDLDMRLALYEGAVTNLGVNNGPMMILPYTSANYIVFKLVTEGIPWTEKEFHEKWGSKEGDQPDGRGRWIFGPDDYETIIAELSKSLSATKEMTA
jgi:hypothetical protein